MIEQWEGYKACTHLNAPKAAKEKRFNNTIVRLHLFLDKKERKRWQKALKEKDYRDHMGVVRLGELASSFSEVSSNFYNERNGGLCC